MRDWQVGSTDELKSFSPHVWPASLSERYRPVRVLGKGGRSIVVEARDRQESAVAVKLPRQSSGDLSSFVLRKLLRAEAKLLRHLGHPGVVRLLDADPGGEFLLLELLPESSLKVQGAARDLPIGATLRCAAAIARAVAHIHASGFLHLDVKPHNVLLRGGNLEAPVLIDFGSSRPLAKPIQAGTIAEGKLGSGKYRFKAPEQLMTLGTRFGVGTDAFGLGTTLFWLLTGSDAFDNQVSKSTEAWSAYRSQWCDLDRRLSGICVSKTLVDHLLCLIAPALEKRPMDLNMTADLLEREANAHRLGNA